MKPAPMPIDPAQTGYQALEDMATAYWTSQVLFTALELELFGHLEAGADTCETLARAAGCSRPELDRLLTALASLGLVAGPKNRNKGDQYWNSQVASRYLVPGKPGYMGDFFLYRRYMRPQWDALTPRVSDQPEPEACSDLKVNRDIKSNPDQDLSYEERNFRYVRAMDTLARHKAWEIAGLVQAEQISGPVLDAGGGAGALARAVVKACGPVQACLFDIPEVIEAAGRLYPGKKDWEGISRIGGDFRTHEFEDRYGLVMLSNFLHAYGREEAKALLAKAAGLLAPGGLMLIHDYFPDQGGPVPQKGALYDLAMMLNTYNGTCPESRTLMDWCRGSGLSVCAATALSTDSAVILARQEGDLHLHRDRLETFAAGLDLEAFVPMDPAHVVTVPWARQKCRTGCARYNKGLQCPPHGMDHHQTRELLDSYTRAWLVRGTPPGKQFHHTLLSLEKKAFLEGHHKAFVLGAGPCTVCPDCPPENGICRSPHLARPSMEGSGIDVYATADRAGISLKPLPERGQYVTYIGLLLVE